MRRHLHGLPKNTATQLGKIITLAARYVVNPKGDLSTALGFQNIDIPKIL